MYQDIDSSKIPLSPPFPKGEIPGAKMYFDFAEALPKIQYWYHVISVASATICGVKHSALLSS
jgi:hypothetical protein